MQLLTVQQSNTGVKGTELPHLAAKFPVAQLNDRLGLLPTGLLTAPIWNHNGVTQEISQSQDLASNNFFTQGHTTFPPEAPAHSLGAAEN